MEGKVVSAANVTPLASSSRGRRNRWDTCLHTLQHLPKDKAFLVTTEEMAKELGVEVEDFGRKEFQSFRTSLQTFLKKHHLFHHLYTTPTSEGLVVGVRPVDLDEKVNELPAKKVK